MSEDATRSHVPFCAGPNGCVFDDLYTGAPLDNCRYCGRTREEAHPYPPLDATPDRAAYDQGYSDGQVGEYQPEKYATPDCVAKLALAVSDAFEAYTRNQRHTTRDSCRDSNWQPTSSGRTRDQPRDQQ